MVKLWQSDVARSVSEIRVGVNVCCVEFCGAGAGGGNQLAFGSADHCVHLYDIRQTRGPVAVFQGHRKAVSYVKFLQADELVSAFALQPYPPSSASPGRAGIDDRSTDAELRIWSMGEAAAVRVLKGHQNERNFVGLATNADYITCGKPWPV